MTLGNPIIPITYGAFGDAAASFQHVRTTAYSHVEVSNRIRQAIQEAELWVLGEVDAQAFVRRGGYEIGGALQILAFHPRFLTRILAEDPSALLGAPLKFAILETPDGKVAVSWSDQNAAFARYARPALKDLGGELEELCEAIVAYALS